MDNPVIPGGVASQAINEAPVVGSNDTPPKERLRKFWEIKLTKVALSRTFVIGKSSEALPKVPVMLGGEVTTLDEVTNGEEGRYNGEYVALSNITEHDLSCPLMKIRGIVAPATPIITVSRGVNQLRFRIKVRL